MDHQLHPLYCTQAEKQEMSSSGYFSFFLKLIAFSSRNQNKWVNLSNHTAGSAT